MGDAWWGWGLPTPAYPLGSLWPTTGCTNTPQDNVSSTFQTPELLSGSRVSWTLSVEGWIMVPKDVSSWSLETVNVTFYGKRMKLSPGFGDESILDYGSWMQSQSPYLREAEEAGHGQNISPCGEEQWCGHKPMKAVCAVTSSWSNFSPGAPRGSMTSVFWPPGLWEKAVFF